jgi:Putative DNA-binding domain
MLNKRIDQLTIDDLENLVTTRQAEVQRLEFKRDLEIKGDGKKELLRDITAMSNTRGGFIVFGIDEANGEAIAMPGIELADPDATILQIESIIRDNSEPKLTGFSTRNFKLQTGRFMMVIYIAQSSNPPHRATGDQFFARASNGKYPMSVTQLRQVFTQGAQRLERLRSLISSRLEVLNDDREEPVTFKGNNGKVVAHFVPVVSLDGDVAIPVGQQLERQLFPVLRPYGFRDSANDYPRPRYNVDGLMFKYERSSIVAHSTQIFRGGYFEGVESKNLAQRPRWQPGSGETGENVLRVFAEYITENTLLWVGQCLQVCRQLEINPPYVFTLSLLRPDGAVIENGRGGELDQIRINRPDLRLPEITLEEVELFFELGLEANHPDSRKALGVTLKPIFDALWQSAGYPGSPES